MELTQQQADEVNIAYAEACKTMDGLIILDGYYPSDIGEDEQMKAQKSLALFKQVLELVPDHFPSLFFTGKIFQRLKDHEHALIAFETALLYEQENHNLPQEASITAMELGLLDKGVAYSFEALRRQPENVALMGNLAMNLMLAERDEEAKLMIDNAMEQDPTDTINLNVRNLIYAVIHGDKPRPTYKELMS